MQPLKFVVGKHWDELKALVLSGELSHDVMMLVGELIIAHLHKISPPSAADPILIANAREHLGRGILLVEHGRELLFDVAIVAPDSRGGESLTPFFTLVPRFSGGKIKRLEEFEQSVPPAPVARQPEAWLGME